MCLWAIFAEILEMCLPKPELSFIELFNFAFSSWIDFLAFMNLSTILLPRTCVVTFPCWIFVLLVLISCFRPRVTLGEQDCRLIGFVESTDVEEEDDDDDDPGLWLVDWLGRPLFADRDRSVLRLGGVSSENPGNWAPKILGLPAGDSPLLLSLPAGDAPLLLGLVLLKDDSVLNVFDKLEARKLKPESFCLVVLVAIDDNVFDLSLWSLLVLDLIIVVVANLVFFFSSIDDTFCFPIWVDFFVSIFGFWLGDEDLTRALLVLAPPANYCDKFTYVSISIIIYNNISL